MMKVMVMVIVMIMVTSDNNDCGDCGDGDDGGGDCCDDEDPTTSQFHLLGPALWAPCNSPALMASLSGASALSVLIGGNALGSNTSKATPHALQISPRMAPFGEDCPECFT